MLRVVDLLASNEVDELGVELFPGFRLANQFVHEEEAAEVWELDAPVFVLVKPVELPEWVDNLQSVACQIVHELVNVYAPVHVPVDLHELLIELDLAQHQPGHLLEAHYVQSLCVFLVDEIEGLASYFGR